MTSSAGQIDVEKLCPVVASQAMLRIFSTIERVASSVVPVLILGETGTGKEIVARTIHERSSRSTQPFRCVNCGGLAETLVESTLFGHEKGAFTGAMGQKLGVFEAAHRGTVFLDELGELPLSAQASLLRVLESKCITRLGAVDEIPVDVRILAATHRDLERMCEAGQFRWDLYYRLNVISLILPPLRHRPEDVPPLVDRFMRAAARANERPVRGFSPSALARLSAYSWPGNVRELKNVVERAVVIASGDWVDVEDLPAALHICGSESDERFSKDTRAVESSRGDRSNIVEEDSVDAGEVTEDLSPFEPILDYKTQMQHAERRVLLAALHRTELNQTEAAKLLRMPLRTLVHKISALGLREELTRLKAARRRG